jgi:hypothetical protein
MEPKLGGEGVPVNMDMWRFMQVVTDKVEPVRSGPQDGWGHLSIPLLSLLADILSLRYVCDIVKQKHK